MPRLHALVEPLAGDFSGVSKFFTPLAAEVTVHERAMGHIHQLMTVIYQGGVWTATYIDGNRVHSAQGAQRQLAILALQQVLERKQTGVNIMKVLKPLAALALVAAARRAAA